MTAIAQTIAAGEPVYLHETIGLMPDVIAGCYLVGKGLTGNQALYKLSRLREEAFGNRKRARLAWELNEPEWTALTMRGLKTVLKHWE